LEFAAATVAAALETDATEVEKRCLDLSHNQRFLRVAAAEEWPDGTQSMRFAFTHALHQELWQQGLNRRRGEQWHLRIAKRLEAAYGARAPDIASELAAHFERGGDHPRAIAYCEHAAALAMQRAANAEAKVHLDHALELLAEMPEASIRVQLELRLLVGLGTVSALAEGFTAPDAEAAFQRAYEIYRSSREVPELLWA
jgi:predicted ATPase